MRDSWASGFRGLEGPPQFGAPALSYNLASSGVPYTVPIPPNAAPGTVAASGTLSFGSNPSDGETIVLNGVTWKFVDSGASGDETNIAGTVAGTVQQFVSDLNDSVTAGIAVATYEGFGSAVVIVYDTPGFAGNTYDMTDVDADITPSWDFLTGGEGNGPEFVLVSHEETSSLALLGLPCLSDDATAIGDLPAIMGTRSSGVVLDTHGVTYIRMAALAANFGVRLTPLENGGIVMIGPPVLRTVATETACSTTPANVAIPDNLYGKRPKYVMIGGETAVAVLGKPCLTADATALADLPIIQSPYGDPVILNVAGCTHVRLAGVASVDVRMAALENGGSAEG
jgi:hypothetical protein